MNLIHINKITFSNFFFYSKVIQYKSQKKLPNSTKIFTISPVIFKFIFTKVVLDGRVADTFLLRFSIAPRQVGDKHYVLTEPQRLISPEFKYRPADVILRRVTHLAKEAVTQNTDLSLFNYASSFLLVIYLHLITT